MDRILEGFYNNPRYGLGGANAFYKKIKKQVPDLTLNKVKEFLKGREEHQVNVEHRRAHDYNRIRANAPFESMQMDLLDLQRFKKANRGFSFILGLIDVYSRKAWAYPLKSKTPNEIYPILQQFVAQYGTPKTITTDLGSEFKGMVKQVLQSNSVEHETSLIKNRVALINRFFRTLRQKIKRLPAFNWVDVLEDLVDNYNDSENRVIQATPDEIYHHQKDPPREVNEPHVVLTFEDGDVVRIRENVTQFTNRQAPRWSRKEYIINGVEGQSYILYDIDSGKKLKERFTNDRLMKIKNDRDLLINILEGGGGQDDGKKKKKNFKDQRNEERNAELKQARFLRREGLL